MNKYEQVQRSLTLVPVLAKILVIGSRGTVGRPLTAELARRGHEVCQADAMHSSDARYRRCDISEFRQVEELLDEGNAYDYIYNLAAEFGRKNGEDYYENLWRTNVIGLKNILHFQQKKRFRLVHFSSSEIYGEVNLRSGELIREDLSNETPLFQTNDYAISKWVNELQIRNACALDRRLETLTVRLFNAYGPGEYYTPYRSVVTQFIYKALHHIPYEVFLNYHRVFMYIDDAVRTLANIVDHFKPGEVYNIGGKEYVEVKAVSDMILEYLGMDDSLVKYLPEDKHNVVSKRPDISKAMRDLMHDPKTSLAEGIPKTIEWMKKC